MDCFKQILLDNKKSKGKQLDTVIAAVSQMDSLLHVYTYGGDHSAIGLSIALSHNEAQARKAVEALIEKGADVKDTHLRQKHDRCINQALKERYYDLAFFLLSKGAKPDDIVHAYLYRPKNTRDAKGQLLMEQYVWRNSDEQFKKEEHIAVMASLIACEIITGQSTDLQIRNEITQAYMEDYDGQGHPGYLLSNIDDAARILKNPEKATRRIIQTVSNWYDGIGDQFEHIDREKYKREHIPNAFWEHLPSIRSELQANKMADLTSPVSQQKRSLRL